MAGKLGGGIAFSLPRPPHCSSPRSPSPRLRRPQSDEGDMRMRSAKQGWADRRSCSPGPLVVLLRSDEGDMRKRSAKQAWADRRSCSPCPLVVPPFGRTRGICASDPRNRLRRDAVLAPPGPLVVPPYGLLRQGFGGRSRTRGMCGSDPLTMFGGSHCLLPLPPRCSSLRSDEGDLRKRSAYHVGSGSHVRIPPLLPILQPFV